MEIKTKYNLDDFVYPIRMGGYEKFIPCDMCSGNGYVKINNTEKTINCPTCYGTKGRKKWKADKWHVCIESTGFIGKIEVQIYDNKYKNEEPQYRYMLSSTGVGSGTVWLEENLFLDKETAQKECDKRNSKNTKETNPPSFIQQGGNKSKSIKK